jgi:hypothetical protein
MVGEFTLPARSSQQCSASHVEHEYLRRLTEQIKRVLPDNGLFFGTGLWPLGSINTSQTYIEKAGLIAHEELHEMQQQHGVGEKIAGRDPFFYTKQRSDS